MDPFLYLIFFFFLILVIVLNKVNFHFFRIFNSIFTILCSISLFLGGAFFLFSSLFISILFIISAIFISLLLYEKFRKNLIKIARLNIDSENPRHYFALLLFFSILFTSIISFLFVSETGKGLFKTEIVKISVLDIVINEIFYIAVAILGYGYLTRKNLTTTLNDLGVKKLSFSNFLFGFIVGIGLIFLVAILSLIFMNLGFEKEDPKWLKDLINIQNAFIIGLSAGICEEILFRGALQPKFGIALTALLFTFLHLQYQASWALFIIFVVGIILGYVRKITDTTTTIVAHSTYNVVTMLVYVIYSV